MISEGKDIERVISYGYNNVAEVYPLIKTTTAVSPMQIDNNPSSYSQKRTLRTEMQYITSYFSEFNFLLSHN